ncbi:MAG: hypothetical protein SFV15_26635 [Polyangiaceae bacterium]|nr:hypothetical protein [Polyangiaceae bacterium]
MPGIELGTMESVNRKIRASSRIPWFSLGLAAAGIGIGAVAHAAPPKPRPFLLGGPLVVEASKLRIDPTLPTGEPIYRSWREPPSAVERACSFRRPVCVSGTGALFQKRGSAFLGALESAYDRVVLGMGLPPPRGAARADENLDLYVSEHATPFNVVLSERPLSVFDEGRVFCEAPLSMRPEEAATLCVAQAVAHQLDPGAGSGVIAAFSDYIHLLTLGPSDRTLEAIHNFQQSPHLGFFSDEDEGAARGSWVLFDYLEAHSPRGPGWASAAWLSASAGLTPVGAWRFFDEPDVFDVLRHTFEEDPVRFASFSANFALDRAFLGSRSRPLRPISLLFSGGFGHVRFDWSIKASSLPRRVASVNPLRPNGSEYVWLELDKWTEKDVLGFEAEWEEPVPFKWTLSKITKSGEVAGTLDIPFQQKARSVQQRLVGLEGMAGVLVVGTNLGGIRSDQPFDPDVGPFEPHGCTVYLAKVAE